MPFEAEEDSLAAVGKQAVEEGTLAVEGGSQAAQEGNQVVQGDNLVVQVGNQGNQAAEGDILDKLAALVAHHLLVDTSPWGEVVPGVVVEVVHPLVVAAEGQLGQEHLHPNKQ